MEFQIFNYNWNVCALLLQQKFGYFYCNWIKDPIEYLANESKLRIQLTISSGWSGLQTQAET